MRQRHSNFLSILGTAGMMLLAGVHLNCGPARHDSSKKAAGAGSSFDTSLVTRSLALTRADSAVLHYNVLHPNLDGLPLDVVRRVIVSPSLHPVYLRTLLSTHTVQRGVTHLGSFVILYSTLEGPLHVKTIKQDSIEFNPGSLDGIEPELTIADVNHDGFKDLVISFIQNTCGNNSCNSFWLYDSSTHSFASDSALNRQFADQPIFVDEGAREIDVAGRVGMEVYGEEYRWTGRKYELHAEFTTRPSEDGQSTITTRREMYDGKWKITADTAR